MKYIWNYAFDYFMRKYWGNQYRSIPVFLEEMQGDMIGNFRHDELGCNSIVIDQSRSKRKTDARRIATRNVSPRCL